MSSDAVVMRIMTLRGSVAHHLLPGAVLTLVFIATAPRLHAAGLPATLGLLAAVPLLLVPYVLASTHAVRRTEDISPAARWVEVVGLGRPSWSTALRVLLPALGASLLLPGLAVPLEGWLRGLADRVLPAWWHTGLDPAGQPDATRGWVLLGWVGCGVIVGPIAEELWFRGVLQPRTPGGPLVGSLLFAAYHLWQPYAWPTIALTTIPMAWARARAGAWAAIVIHVLVNAFSALLLVADVVRR